eukprot:GFUD01105042.1.p1 GENE.GFUD01105042.1~~GFUD01105042.1.p1  ORF type:complete len:496 (-),score=166.67 GFUD01105042.1:124-1611(-)
MKFSMLAVPGSAPGGFISGVDSKGETAFSINDYKGKFLVIVFYHGDWECQEYLQAFSDLQDKFRSVKAEVVGCSTDSTKVHQCWIKTDREDGGFSGKLNLALWSDPSGSLASQYDLYDEEENQCLDGVVIIDDEGIVRHAMTTSLECGDTANNSLEMVRMLKVYKVDDIDSKKSKPVVLPTKIDPAQLEKDWDISRDPELLKVLDIAKRLGQKQPPQMVYKPKNPTFDLLPTRIRRLVNPKASLKSCSASLQRNLAGFGPSGDVSVNQRLQIENIMKKVMGVAYMPEDLTGNYTSLVNLNQREQTKMLEGGVFTLTGDAWMKEPGAVQWTEGKGVFVNNYENFVLWVNLADQLKLVSTATGQDIKYVLLRLQKAAVRIEEAIKSCQQKGFTTNNNGFAHGKKGVYGTGFEISFTLELPGFQEAGRAELDKARANLNLKIEPEGFGARTFSVVLTQLPDDSEHEIATKSVETVDKLWKMDLELQSRFGIKQTRGLF